MRPAGLPGSFTGRLRRVLLAAAVAAATTPGIDALTPTALAAATVTLASDAPARVLYGSTATVTLTAANAPGNDPLYNASFRAVLPAGVALTTGAPAPTKSLANRPAAGQTTLLWENIGDIQPGASLPVSLTVAHTPGNDAPANPIHAGDSYTVSSAVYAHDNPRFVPDFDANGAPIAGTASYTTTASASSATQAVPLRITKDEPSAEGELLRGVHDQTTVYTLTVTNNPIAATNGVVVEDFLPAALEFLGCGGTDNTPSGSPRRPERPGAALLSATPPPPAPCPTPVLVDTVSDPVGRPPGIYTQVRWNLGSMAAGQVAVVRYRAASRSAPTP